MRPLAIDMFSVVQPPPSPLPARKPPLGALACCGVRQVRTVVGGGVGALTPLGMLGTSIRSTSVVISHCPGCIVAAAPLPAAGGAASFPPAGACWLALWPPHEASSTAA